MEKIDYKCLRHRQEHAVIVRNPKAIGAPSPMISLAGAKGPGQSIEARCVEGVSHQIESSELGESIPALLPRSGTTICSRLSAVFRTHAQAEIAGGVLQRTRLAPAKERAGACCEVDDAAGTGRLIDGRDSSESRCDEATLRP